MSVFRLILVRHAQTPSNVINSLDSKPPGPPLTEEGWQQAREVAKLLAGEPVSAVYASATVRTQQTAAEIAAVHGLDVQVVDGVQEVFVGDLEGRNDDEALIQFATVFASWTSEAKLDVAMPGGESASQVLDRYLASVAAIRERHGDGVAVLVSHGAAMRLASFALADNIGSALAEARRVPNTGRVVLEVDPDAPNGWRCLEWVGVPL